MGLWEAEPRGGKELKKRVAQLMSSGSRIIGKEPARKGPDIGPSVLPTRFIPCKEASPPRFPKLPNIMPLDHECTRV